MIRSISGLQTFQILRYSGQIAVAVLLAQSGIGRYSIGIYESLLLISGMTGFFWVGGLMNALIPRFRKSDEATQPRLLNSAFLTMLILSGLLFAGLRLFEAPLTNLLNRDSIPGYQLFTWFVLLNNPTFLLEYLLFLKPVGKGKSGTQLLIYGLLVFALQIVLIGLPAINGHPIESVVQGMVIFAGIKFGLLLLAIGPSLFKGLDREAWAGLMRLGSPIALSLLLGGISVYIDGLIVANRMGAESLAVFQYGARELPLVLLLANAFSAAAAGTIASDQKAGLAEIRDRSYVMLRWLFPLTVILMLLSPVLFPLVFTPEFKESWQIFNVYLLLLIPRLLFPQSVLTGRGDGWVLSGVSLVELVVNTALSLWWLQLFGIIGVAYATVAAHLLDKLMLIGHLHFRNQISPSTYIRVPAYLAYSAILAAVFLLSQYFGQQFFP